MRKNSYILENVSTILSDKFLRIFSITAILIFGYFFSTLDKNAGYWEALSIGLTYQQFLTLCFLPMIIISNILLIDLFEKSEMSIIRFKNKNKYLKELLKNIWVSNSFIFLVIMIVILTFLNFLSNGDISINYISEYGITNIIYTFYIIIKLYILIILCSFMFTLFFKLISKTIALIISIIFTASLYLCIIIPNGCVSKISDFPLYIGYYFLKNVDYKFFYLNVLSFLLISVIMILLLFIVYKLTLKKMKSVGV
jgi:hypothetical protein